MAVQKTFARVDGPKPVISDDKQSALREVHDGFDVFRIEKLVDGRGALQGVARPTENDGLPRQGCGVATRCLIPDFNGALFSSEWKEALWSRFVDFHRELTRDFHRDLTRVEGMSRVTRDGQAAGDLSFRVFGLVALSLKRKLSLPSR